jgi:glycosyltransferase involved in cell wall biosynthesis
LYPNTTDDTVRWILTVPGSPEGMDLSVVVPTLNGRDQLGDCLDALTATAPDAEVIVVNGPSADGTTGMVQEREDVAALVELSDRNVNVARNAGVAAATAETVAFVSYDRSVESSWRSTLAAGLEDGGDVVTGPTHRELRAGMTTESEEIRRVSGREVTYFNRDNVAFRRSALEAVDGFDEGIAVGGARDAAHRLAGLEYDVDWRGGMSVRSSYSTDGGDATTDWGAKYRSLSYRLFKNYGLRPTVVGRVVTHACGDAYDNGRAALRGDATPSGWFANGKDVVVGTAGGVKSGLAARARDRDPRRNPHGLSARSDRAVTTYDWR